jgi:hypothetical protein
MKTTFVIEVCVGATLIPSSCIIEKRFRRKAWVALLAAGITMIVQGTGAFWVFGGMT